jgi:uncharacterized membrane protein YsdA (DUF1294 family)
LKILKTIAVVLLSMLIFMVLAKLLITLGRSNENAYWGLAAYLVLINIYGFSMMIIDKKRSSKASRQRISERSLFTASALGGSLGTLMAMKAARHKTKHWPFKVIFPIILVIQGLYLLFGFTI